MSFIFLRLFPRLVSVTRFLIILASWVTCIPVQAAPSGWSTNLAETLQVSLQQGKPVLAYFTAPWCGACKLMARTTLQDDEVLKAFQKFACVEVDFDADTEAVKRYSVEGIPCILILDGDGDVVSRTSGYLSASGLKLWLIVAEEAVAATKERKRQFQAQRQELLTALASDNAKSRQEAVRRLFDLCARRVPSEQSFAITQFKSIAAREPALLLEGLDHTDLATRIQAANALYARLGEAFHFDPWEKSHARKSALATLRTRLTSLESPEK